MKLQELIKNTKREYSSSVVLAKSGTFYIAYGDDSYVLSYLFSYQINDNKVGFPVNSIDKVLEKLKEKKINVIIINSDIKYEFEDNNYDNVLYNAKKEYYNDLNAKLLMDEIGFVVKNNPDNIDKIRSFINEL